MRTMGALLILGSLGLQACQSAPPYSGSLDGYSFPANTDEIPSFVLEEGHPEEMFSYDIPPMQAEALETEITRYGRSVGANRRSRTTRYNREVVHQSGPFVVGKTRDSNGVTGYFAFYGPFSMNSYRWRDDGSWRAWRVTEVTNVQNPPCAEGIEQIGGFDPNRLCWVYDWAGDRVWSSGEKGSNSGTSSTSVTGTTEVTVNVNGTDYLLPGYTVERSNAGTPSEVVYVPVLGLPVQFSAGGPGPVIGKAVTEGRAETVTVSPEVLEEVRAAAIGGANG